MQEAFRRALDQLEHDRQEPHLDTRNLKVLHSAPQDCTWESRPPVPETQLTKLTYGARRLAHRWCSYTRTARESPELLDALRDDWVVFARQLGPLSHLQRVLLFWEMASTTRPENIKHDGERFHYLARKAAAHPELFVGLSSSPYIPWPGPASFFVHAVEELEAASVGERVDLHRVLAEQWKDEPGWLMYVLADWVHGRHQNSLS